MNEKRFSYVYDVLSFFSFLSLQLKSFRFFSEEGIFTWLTKRIDKIERKLCKYSLLFPFFLSFFPPWIFYIFRTKDLVRFSRFEISPNLLRNSIQQPWSENSFSRFSNIPSTLSPSPPDFLQYFLKFEVTVAANDFPGNFFPRPRMNAFQLTAVLGSFVIEFRPDVPPPLLSVSKSRRAFDRGGFPYFATRVYTRHPFSRIIARVIPRFLLTGKFSTTNPLHPLGCLVPYWNWTAFPSRKDIRVKGKA